MTHIIMNNAIKDVNFVLRCNNEALWGDNEDIDMIFLALESLEYIKGWR